MKRTYYILYKDVSNINYIYLLKLYKIAKCYNDTLIRNTIQYKTIKELAEKADIKYTTLTKMLKDKQYKDYFIVKDKQIILNNNFKEKKNVSFITLNEEQVDYLIQMNDNLLAKYFIYHKYYCGFSKDNKHNSTAKQILETMGYSSKSNNYISKISEYNKLLCDNGMICIQNYIEDGKYRIIYSIA